ncbi:MAG: M24 family metallopeptidase [Agriterribacter sp.]
MSKQLLLILFFFSVIVSSKSQVLSLREQSRIMDELLAERLDSLLPQLMQKNNIDMWIVMSREYNEDPVLRTMLPSTWLSARRRTILVFYNDPSKKQYEKLAVARYNVGTSIKAAWDMQRFPDQWDALVNVITSRNPKKIGLNYSADFGHADGIDHTGYQQFLDKLSPALKSRIVSAEKLAVAWLETRTAREMEIYPQLIDISHRIIEEGFSERVITPGITTTEDVVWWFRQKIDNMGLTTWFHPTVEIQRNDQQSAGQTRNFSARQDEQVIMAGDLLHCDFGISYLRLNTDIQQHAYVLKPGETAAPESIQQAFANTNRLQDILTAQFKEGKTGNEILAAALAQAKQENINATIYTHPIGFHGHAAGTTIGMWDMQHGVPGSGDYPMHYNTAYSIELNAAINIPEWKKTVRIMLEEDGFFDEHGFRYIQGRQKEIYLIPRIKQHVK